MNKQLLRMKIIGLNDEIDKRQQSRDELKVQLVTQCQHPKVTVGSWTLNKECVICETCGSTWHRTSPGWYDMKYRRNTSVVDCRADFDKWQL